MASFSRFIDAFNFLHHEWKYSRQDPWGIRASSYEQGKMMQQFVLVNDRTYARALDVGCGGGDFTSLLAKISTAVIALERSTGAIRQARANLKNSPNVSLVSENIRTYALPSSHFGLIVLGEVLYYLSYVSGDRRLGKQSGLSSLEPLIQKLQESLTPAGRILMTNYFSPRSGSHDARRRRRTPPPLRKRRSLRGIRIRGSLQKRSQAPAIPNHSIPKTQWELVNFS